LIWDVRNSDAYNTTTEYLHVIGHQPGKVRKSWSKTQKDNYMPEPEYKHAPVLSELYTDQFRSGYNLTSFTCSQCGSRQ